MVTTSSAVDNAVLVTGAGGFVGSAVVRLLVTSMRGVPPRFVDDTPVRHVIALLRRGGDRARLQELPPSADWSIVEADLADRAALRDLLCARRPRAILHLAVDRRIHQELPDDEAYRLNLAPLETLFEGLRGVPGARLIHTSSLWVLPAGDRLDERTALAPRVPYARRKAQADALLPVLSEATAVPWINLRLFNIFGKYEAPSRLLPYIVSRVSQGETAELSDGDNVRDFSDVEDVARAYVLALRAEPSACDQVYHVGSGRGMILRDFAKTVCDVTGNPDLVRFGATERQDQYLACQVADPTRAQRTLGWVPTQDVAGRIRLTATWWLNRWGLGQARLASAP